MLDAGALAAKTSKLESISALAQMNRNRNLTASEQVSDIVQFKGLTSAANG